MMGVVIYFIVIFIAYLPFIPGIILYILFGVYSFGPDRIILLPNDITSGVIFVGFVGISILMVCSALLRRARPRFVGLIQAALLVGTFLVFYLYNIDKYHVALTDSYEMMAGAVEIIYKHRYSFIHKASFGSSLFIIPFMIVCVDEFMAQLAIVFYAALSYLLSVRLWRELKIFDESEKENYHLFIFLLIVNPMFVSIARTISYEPIVIFLFVLLLHIQLKLLDVSMLNKLRSYLSHIIMMFIMLGLLILIRVNYLVVFGLPTILVLLFFYLHVLSSHKDSTGLHRNVYLYFALTLVFSGLLLLLAEALTPTWFKSSSIPAARMFNIYNLLAHLLCSLYVILSAINAPASRQFFPMQIYVLFKVSVLNIAVGIIMLSMVLYVLRRMLRISRYSFYARYLILLMLIDVFFFSAYSGWQARYLIPTLYLEILLFAKALYGLPMASPNKGVDREKPIPEKPTGSDHRIRVCWRRINWKIVGIVFIILVAVSNATMAVLNWRDDAVIFDNIGTRKDDVEQIFRIIRDFDQERKILFTSLEALAVFYNEKMKLGLEIFFVYEFFLENRVTQRSIKFVVSIIRKFVLDGYAVFYLAGWPEINGYRPSSSFMNVKDFFAILLEKFDYDILLCGHLSKEITQGRKSPTFLLLHIISPAH